MGSEPRDPAPVLDVCSRGDQLLREFLVGDAAARRRVVLGDRYAVAGRLAQAHIAWDHGTEGFFRELGADLLGDLEGQRGARVEKGQHNPADLESRVELALNQLRRMGERSDALQRVVLTLD